MSYQTAELTTQEIKAIGKLLLNAWSAEYAIRITPTVKDVDFTKSSLQWTFPQAYYAAFFSARAVLASDGLYVANQKGVNTLMNQRAGAGFYGPTQTIDTNPFSALTVYQLGPGVKPELFSSLDAIALNRKLIDSIQAIAIIHETYILQRLGKQVYQAIIDDLPHYLRDSFVCARFIFICSDEF